MPAVDKVVNMLVTADNTTVNTVDSKTSGSWLDRLVAWEEDEEAVILVELSDELALAYSS